MSRSFPAAAVLAILLAVPSLMTPAVPAARGASAFPVPEIPYAPRRYACGKVTIPPRIDGALDDAAWQGAAWTAPFVDIQGSLRPDPRFRTQAAIAWDDSCLYIAARMEEPDLWATYAKRDAVIYHENDFEVFIDPDGDTHEYYELEMNALNTIWDLLLIKPYRDGGPAVNAWDITGLRTAVHCDGTLNDPSDRDRGWTLEIAIPCFVLAECAHRPSPPRDGDSWRLNFSRVEWTRDVIGGRYVKAKDPKSGRDLPEDNWVWSPQGLIAMHYPEMWGIVQFSTRSPRETGPPDSTDAEEPIRWMLRQVYYEEKEREAEGGGFSPVLACMRGPVDLRLTRSGFEAATATADKRGTWHIREDGRIWRSEP